MTSRKYNNSVMMAVMAAAAVAAGNARGSIISVGDISPVDPSTWTASTVGYIGNTSDGSVTINGGNLLSATDYLGFAAGATGTVTVDGTGSTWTTNTEIRIGYSGTGVLAILNGGSVISRSAYVAATVGASGTVTVDGPGSNWTAKSGTNLFVGTGTINALNGAHITATSTLLGFLTGSVGNITVDGSGSAWTNTGAFTIGGLGTGIVNIAHGGVIAVSSSTQLSERDTGGGSLHFGAAGGTLTTESFFAIPSQLTGTGTINTRGIVSDGDLVFDATHGLSRILTWADVNENVTVNVDMTGGSGSVGDVGAGYHGTGTLAIRDGVVVNSRNGWLGYGKGATGTATVDGIGSIWNASFSTYIGYGGIGTLSITHGGSVTNSADCFVGRSTGSAGTFTIDGTGSSWTGTSLYIGPDGNGALNIINGGKATNAKSEIGSLAGATGVVTVDGTSSSWKVNSSLNVGVQGAGTLNIFNGGIVTVSSGLTFVAKSGTGAGAINFGTNGGTLTTQTLYAGRTQLTGTGTVNVHGMISESDLIFDATHGLNQTVVWNNTSQNITFNLVMASAPSDLGAGYSNSGTLTMQGGVKVGSNGAYLGYKLGALGTATVSGTGTTWNDAHDVYVGVSGTGALNITSGGHVNNAIGYLGSSSSAIGTATISGTGSAWANIGALYVGNAGRGILTINNMGLASNTDGYLGYAASSIGTATVDGTGSTWTNSGSLFIGNSGVGTLAMTNGGSVTNQMGYLGYNASSSGTAIVNGSGSTWINKSTFYIGDSGKGALTISNGGKVTDVTTFLGFDTNAVGTAIVDGPGSLWSNTGFITVGRAGTGALTITNGGKVSSGSGNLGTTVSMPGAGLVTVDGPGSTWNISGLLGMGNATLKLTNGGKVTAALIAMVANSLLVLNVGDGSNLDCGGGEVVNNGIVRLRAIPNLPTGNYSPITGRLVGLVPVQALGGSWNSETQTFTVSSAAAGSAGQPVSIDLFQTQRIAITDPTSGNHVYANFQATSDTSDLTFTASMLSDSQRSLLATTLPTGAILGGWTFATTGYTAGDPVFLSMDIGSGRSPGELAIWHYDGTAWAPYATNDLTYDGNRANFTVTGFSGYAVTAVAVPEPGALILMGLGSILVMARRRR